MIFIMSILLSKKSIRAGGGGGGGGGGGVDVAYIIQGFAFFFFTFLFKSRFTIVESIPENLTYSPAEPIMMSTYKAHKRLLEKVKKTLYLSSCYWTLMGTDTDYHDYSSIEVCHLYVVFFGTETAKVKQNVNVFGIKEMVFINIV